MSCFPATEILQLHGSAKSQATRPLVRLATERRLPGLVALPRSADHMVRMCVDQYSGTCGRARFRYGRGDVDIVPAGATEQWEVFTPSTTLAVSLPEAMLGEAAERAGLSSAKAGLGLAPRFQFRDPQIEHVVWALNAEQHAGNPHGTIYTEFLGMALAIHLTGTCGAAIRPSGGLARHALRKVTEYIESNLDHDLSLSSLAALAELSMSHFGAQFKKSTGLAVHEYVVTRRVERAKHLLQGSAMPVSQVALAVGFAHQSHLARWMRRLLGVTPGEVRRSRAPA